MAYNLCQLVCFALPPPAATAYLDPIPENWESDCLVIYSYDFFYQQVGFVAEGQLDQAEFELHITTE